MSRHPRRPAPKIPARFRPGCEPLEDRTTPATATLNAGVLQIDFAASGTTAESVTVASDGTKITLSGDVTGATSNAVADVTRIVVTDSGGGTRQTVSFGGTAGFSLSGGLSSTGVESIAVGTDITAAGAGGITLDAPGAVGVAAVGISIDGAALATENGNISLTGTGGDTGTSDAGVSVTDGGSVAAGGGGTVTIDGTGADTDMGYGVFVSGAGSEITSAGGSVTVTGRGALGVVLTSGGEISAGGTGAVAVNGTGGTVASGQNWGVFVSGTGSQITSSGGAVTVTGTGGGTAAGQGNNVGVGITSGGEISAGGAGTVTVTGTGGQAGGNLSATGNNYGVYLESVSGTTGISSAGGDVTVTGTGGGLPGAAGSNVGVLVARNGLISAGGTGRVAVTGTGGATGGATDGGRNAGVVVQASGATITSSGGNVRVVGTGGGIANGQGSNHGVWLNTGGEISAGGAGKVTVRGVGGADGGGTNGGVVVQDTGTQITSSGGDVAVTANGGGTAGGEGVNIGLLVNTGGKVGAAGAGTVTVVATGGAGGSENHGVLVTAVDSTVRSEGGDVSVTGVPGGGGVLANNLGVSLESGGTISANQLGKLDVVGLPTFFAVGGSDGTVRVVNSANGATVVPTFRPLFAAGRQYTGIVSVALADVNGDSVPELFAAAASPLGEATLDASKAGKVFVFDGVALVRGLNPSASHTFTPFPTTDGPAGSTAAYTNGLNIAAGDVNGDGKIDLVAGTRGGSATAGAREYGRLAVLSMGAAPDGSADTPIGSIVKPFGNGYEKGVVVAAGDLDGDGRDEIAVTRGGPVVQTNPNKTVKLKAFKFDGELTELNLSGQTDGNGNTVVLAPFGAITGTDGSVIDRDARVAFVDTDGDGRATLVFSALDRISTPGSTRLRMAAYSVDTNSGVATLVSTGTGTTPTTILLDGTLLDHAISHGDIEGDGSSDLAIIVESNPSGILYLDPITGAFQDGGFALTVRTGGVTLAGT